jgi:hypothetical protein
MDNFSSPPPRAKEPTCPLHGAISGLRWQDADNPNGLGLAESYPLSPRSGGEVPLVERQRTKAWMQQLSRGPIWQKVLPDGDSKRSVRLQELAAAGEGVICMDLHFKAGARWASQHPERHYSAGFHAYRALTSGKSSYSTMACRHHSNIFAELYD